MRRLLIASLLAAAFAAQAETTASGHSYSPPEAFTASASGGVLRFTAPEGDTTVTVVDLAAAKDAADAVAQAWARAEDKGRDAARVAVEMANLLEELG